MFAGYDEAKKTPYLTSKAFGEDGNSQITVNEARNPKDQNDQELINEPQYDNSIDITKYYYDEIVDMVKNLGDGENKITDDQNQSSDKINALSTKYDVIYYSMENLTINLNQPISGDTKTPLYIIMDCNHVNFQFSADMSSGRPVVMVYTNRSKQVRNNIDYGLRFEGNGGTFMGDIYAPFDGVYVNDNRIKFSGSIVAQGIDVNSQGYYAQENYTDSSDAPGDPTVILVDDKEIEWT